jgi:hypothetical protein
LPPRLLGPSIEVDPGYEYFQNRTEESVASEIRVNGFRVVRYVVTNDDHVDQKLIDAFHSQGISLWYETFGNGFYGSSSGLPKGWEAWQMSLLNPEHDSGYTFLSLSNSTYRKWKCARIVSTLKKHNFDGIEIVEPFQMGWDGPEKGAYGDFSPAAIAAFREFSGYDSAPEFKDKTSKRWYRTDVPRYRKWIEFRVREVDGFLSQIGESVRKSAPGRPLGIWALANSSPDPAISPVAVEREWQGIDAGEMANAANADLIVFETNWPDWSNPDLQGNYPNLYRPFFEELRSKAPGVPFMVQADIGSLAPNRRSRAWLKEFEETCVKDGAAGSTSYAYPFGLWTYTEPPEVRETRIHGNRLKLVFQKRLNPKSAVDLSHYVFQGREKILAAKVDGNEVTLTVGGLNKGDKLVVRGVEDDPKTWLLKDKPPNKSDQVVTLEGAES